MKNKIPINKSQTLLRKHAASTSQASVDWCINNKVSTPIKNQLQCGSCWAFSAIESLESREVILEGKPLKILSEEFPVQCDHNGDQGCNGGLPSNA